MYAMNKSLFFVACSLFCPLSGDNECLLCLKRWNYIYMCVCVQVCEKLTRAEISHNWLCAKRCFLFLFGFSRWCVFFSRWREIRFDCVNQMRQTSVFKYFWFRSIIRFSNFSCHTTQFCLYLTHTHSRSLSLSRNFLVFFSLVSIWAHWISMKMMVMMMLLLLLLL